MKTQPADLNGEEIANALSLHWGIDGVSLAYVPLGFGSHHWVANEPYGRKWFVTVDDLEADPAGRTDTESYDNLSNAFRTSEALRDRAGLTWVVGPTPARTGDPIVRLTNRFTLAVFAYLDVEPTEFGEFCNLADRDEAMRLIGAVHNATSSVPLDALRRDTLNIPKRAGLHEALSTLDLDWDSGPYAARSQAYLRENADLVPMKLERFDRLVRLATDDPRNWVVTHGEPHAGNVIRTRTGDLVVVDWDTVAYAPRERDLWMMANDANPDWSAYRDITGVSSLSQAALEAYRLHWDLMEIAIYVSWLRQRHGQTEEMKIAWSSLQQYVKS